MEGNLEAVEGNLEVLSKAATGKTDNPTNQLDK